MQFRGFALITRVAAALGIAFIVIAAGIWYFKPTLNDYLASYYVWRVGKTGTSNLDQFRARQGLFGLIADPGRSGPAEGDRPITSARRTAMGQLVHLVGQPGLPMERVDLALQILLENRGAVAGSPELPNALLRSLRGTSVDARMRVNEALKFLAEHCPEPVGKELSEWKPNNGDYRHPGAEVEKLGTILVEALRGAALGGLAPSHDVRFRPLPAVFPVLTSHISAAAYIPREAESPGAQCRDIDCR